MIRIVGSFAALALVLLAGCGVEDTDERAQSANSVTQGTGDAAAAPAASLFPSQTTAATASSASASHESLRFVKTFQAGYDRALAENKPMLLFFTAEWCHFCHQMADEAFVDPEVLDLANRFVCVAIDADAEPEVCEKYRVQGYPTVQFLSARGVPLNRLVGKRPTEQVVRAMQAVLQNVAQHTEASGTKTR